MIRRKTSSGVSIGIQNTLFSLQNGNQLIEKQKPAEFTIKIANTLEEREKAYRLAYKVYLEKGYINPNGNEWMVQSYDANNETITLIVEDSKKRIAGTMTVLLGASTKLPADKLYKTELNFLRQTGNKIAENSRLVVAPDYRNSKEILVLLFNYMFVYIFYLKNYDLLTIQVNPRHKEYYKKLLGFDEIGCEKPCPQVQNAPAILLSLSKTKYYAEIRRCLETTIKDPKDRTLYPHFVNAEQEKLVAYYLEKQAKPMTKEEKNYFGFSESGISRTVCI